MVDGPRRERGRRGAGTTCPLDGNKPDIPERANHQRWLVTADGTSSLHPPARASSTVLPAEPRRQVGRKACAPQSPSHDPRGLSATANPQSAVTPPTTCRAPHDAETPSVAQPPPSESRDGFCGSRLDELRSAGGARRSSTKATVSCERLDPRPTAPSDDHER